MKILYITTVFPPPEDGDTIYTDLACALKKHGHGLTVVAADGSSLCKQTTRGTERGLDVLRVRTGKLYDVGLIQKCLAQMTVSTRLKRAIAKFLPGEKYDLILFESPPASLWKAATYAKKKFLASAFLMLKDIAPQNAIDLELYKRSSLIARYFRHQEKRLYQISDNIGCMSYANMDYIRKHNPEIAEKVVYFPNTKAASAPADVSKDTIRKQHRLPKDKIIFVFGGNMGLPQAPDMVIACAKTICEKENAYFLAVGRGSHSDYVRKALNGYDNFRILPNLSRKEYETLLSACDVGLIFLDRRFTVPNFPSRILSYMNCALPTLACIDSASDMDQLIAGSACGISCKAGDTDAFGDCVTKFCTLPEMRKQMGQNGYCYFQKNLTTERSVSLLETYAIALKDGGQ